MDIKELHKLGLGLFNKRSQLMSLCQEIAENFYVERADFTSGRMLADDFAAHLTTSSPIIVRRDLGNSFGSMLRPSNKDWFHMVVSDFKQHTDHEARQWLEWATNVQKRAMYDRDTQFIRAVKEGDHDFAAFGQTVLSVELGRDRSTLLYRCWHLRDVAWTENEQGKIGTVVRRWKPTAADVRRLFPKTPERAGYHETVNQLYAQDPLKEIEVWHFVVEADFYNGPNPRRLPFISIFYDVTHEHVMEEMPIYGRFYVIPRWATVAGSQYAFSPAAIAGLPEARLIQAMAYTLLEAGEKMTNPPMIAVREALRSDVAIYAGGITYADAQYDERLGEVLRPLTQDKSGMPLGMEMQERSTEILKEAFYINKLTMALPADGREMTAYEAGQRVQEYIRHAIPLFEPMEIDYNGALCEETFGLMLRSFAFGDPRNMPRSIRGKSVEFRFESPLHDAIERQKGNKFLESQQLIAQAVTLDKSAVAIQDTKKALRDALTGIGAPAIWMRSESEVEKYEQDQAQMAQAQSVLQGMQQGADVAATLAQAGKA